MWVEDETLAKRGCPGVVFVRELWCIPGHSHSFQLFLDGKNSSKAALCSTAGRLKQPSQVWPYNTILLKRCPISSSNSECCCYQTSNNIFPCTASESEGFVTVWTSHTVTRTTNVGTKIKHFTVKPQIQGGALWNTKMHKSVLEQLDSAVSLEERQGKLFRVYRKSDHFWSTREKQNHASWEILLSSWGVPPSSTRNSLWIQKCKMWKKTNKTMWHIYKLLDVFFVAQMPHKFLVACHWDDVICRTQSADYTATYWYKLVNIVTLSCCSTY